MKVLLVHNEYGKISGEEIVVNQTTELLRKNGHDVTYFHRSSAEIPEMWLGKTQAFFSAIHSPSSKRAVRRLLEKKRPDIVHVHNLFPLISPSILPECKRAGIPIVMTVHNYRLICPTGLFMSKPRSAEGVCERCAGGHEYWCALKNCEDNLFKSIGYAIRTWFARVRRLYLDNIDCYAALTHFQRQKLMNEGYPGERIHVIPNMTEFTGCVSAEDGEYIGFVGRLSPEKSIPTLIYAANELPSIPVKAAGDYEGMLPLVKKAPSNFSFMGQLDRVQLEKFFAECRAVVLCSIWYEGFPMVLVEAMLSGKPVIASRIGGIPEIVEDGVTGLLFEPGNADELAEMIRYLWERPELCQKMGTAGRKKALREYSPQIYYERLMAVYTKAIEHAAN